MPAGHRDKLQLSSSKTLLGRGQVRAIIARIDAKRAQMHKVIEQAHERIIGARQVKSAKKILSVHEPDIGVIVRGKAGKEVEFGNRLFISECTGGFIFDYQLYGKKPPPEGGQLLESLQRQKSLQLEHPIQEVVGDRGFDTRKVAEELKKATLTSSICPKNPQELRRRLDEATFRESQRRRGATEARIAIVKNNGRCRPSRAKGFRHRTLAVAWGVLAHNLMWIARKKRPKQQAHPLAA